MGSLFGSLQYAQVGVAKADKSNGFQWKWIFCVTLMQRNTNLITPVDSPCAYDNHTSNVNTHPYGPNIGGHIKYLMNGRYIPDESTQLADDISSKVLLR